MSCFSWLSALFGHTTRHSSDCPSQPLSQELQERKLTSEDHGYEATEPMPQPPTVTLKRDRVGLANWRAYSDSFGQESRDQLMYQRLESMQQLPPPSAVQVRQGITSIDEPPNHGIRVGLMTYTGNIERSYFAQGTFLTLEGARAEIRIEKPDVQWGHVRVERLVLEDGGKEALEVRLQRGLTPDELRSVCQSILKINATENTWSTDELWSCIQRRKEKGNLSDLFDIEDLDWIK